MTDVPIRHSRGRTERPASSGKAAPGRRSSSWKRPLTLLAGGLLLIIAFGGLFQASLEVYHDRLVLTGLTANPTLVPLTIGPENLIIPGNMLRFAKTRIGGPVERADIALYWPSLEGYSDRLASPFKDGSPSAPIVYATISARDTPLDSTGRLDDVYARFFVDKPLPGAAGLVGRRLNQESGYGGEIVYFVPAEPRPFVARCLETATPDVPATCLRDVNFGRSLSLLYRFNRNLLAEWRALDTGMQKLAAGFLAP